MRKAIIPILLTVYISCTVTGCGNTPETKETTEPTVVQDGSGAIVSESVPVTVVPEIEISKIPISEKTFVSIDDVNIRAQPSTDAEVIGGLKRGDRVTVNSEKDGWYNIDYTSEEGNVSGYVSARYVLEAHKLD